MKKSLLALTAAVAFVATPVLAEDTVAITTTKSSQASLAGIGLLGGVVAAAAVIGVVVAVSNSGSGT
ncbi:MAG: hypothetical protein QM492_03470 [Rhodobacterales bacterium]